jgi:hypothetical protein
MIKAEKGCSEWRSNAGKSCNEWRPMREGGGCSTYHARECGMHCVGCDVNLEECPEVKLKSQSNEVLRILGGSRRQPREPHLPQKQPAYLKTCLIAIIDDSHATSQNLLFIAYPNARSHFGISAMRHIKLSGRGHGKYHPELQQGHR